MLLNVSASFFLPFSAPCCAHRWALVVADFPLKGLSKFPRPLLNSASADISIRDLSVRQAIKKGDWISPIAFSVLAEPTRLELATSGVTGRRSNQLNYDSSTYCGGRNRDRTCDPRLVRPMLSQLSYSPSNVTVYLSGEPLAVK